MLQFDQSTTKIRQKSLTRSNATTVCSASIWPMNRKKMRCHSFVESQVWTSVITMYMKMSYKRILFKFLSVCQSCTRKKMLFCFSACPGSRTFKYTSGIQLLYNFFAKIVKNSISAKRNRLRPQGTNQQIWWYDQRSHQQSKLQKTGNVILATCKLNVMWNIILLTKQIISIKQWQKDICYQKWNG